MNALERDSHEKARLSAATKNKYFDSVAEAHLLHTQIFVLQAIPPVLYILFFFVLSLSFTLFP